MIATYISNLISLTQLLLLLNSLASGNSSEFNSHGQGSEQSSRQTVISQWATTLNRSHPCRLYTENAAKFKVYNVRKDDHWTADVDHFTTRCSLLSSLVPYTKIPPEYSSLVKFLVHSSLVHQWYQANRMPVNSSGVTTRQRAGGNSSPTTRLLRASLLVLTTNAVTRCSEFCPTMRQLLTIFGIPDRYLEESSQNTSVKTPKSLDSKKICCFALTDEDSGCIYASVSTPDETLLLSIKSVDHQKTFCHVLNSADISNRQPDDGSRKVGITSSHRHRANRVSRQRRAISTQKDIKENSNEVTTVPLPPRDLQISPLRFGTINISWTPSQLNREILHHYEIVLISLNSVAAKQQIEDCHKWSSLSTAKARKTEFQQPNQFSINVSAPASSAVVEGLPPDQFYRVHLFAVSHSGQPSPPISMPSSPRVPAMPPTTSPRQVRIANVDTNHLQLAWMPPEDASCSGELINYVIKVTSSRLIEPMTIKVGPHVNTQVINNLIPGTYYMVVVAAATRGGVGLESEALQVKTAGELPNIVLDESENDAELMKQMSELHKKELESDGRELSQFSWGNSPNHNFANYKLPLQIYNLRATPGDRHVQLMWSVEMRAVTSAIPGDVGEAPPKREKVETSVNEYQEKRWENALQTMQPTWNPTLVDLPMSLKFVIRWGDVFPGPFEDSVPSNQSYYRITNLRPGTTYYIRVLAVTHLGEGTAAYTVVKTRDTSTVTTISESSLIPINIAVQAVGSTWSRVGWELSSTGSHLDVQTAIVFQIKYYSTPNLQNSGVGYTSTMPSTTTRWTPTVKRDIMTLNVTLPRLVQQGNPLSQFKAILRGLKPATRYEFSVRLMPTDDQLGQMVSQAESLWSMVQGFETYGQEPFDSPRAIRVAIRSTLTSQGAQPNIPIVDVSSISTDRHSTSLVNVGLSWKPPLELNGSPLSSLIYLTDDRRESRPSWLERAVYGQITHVELQGLREYTVYYLQMAAENQYGRSPLSPVAVFRTPDGNGNGGGMFHLSKKYFSPSEINEPLLTPMEEIPEDVDRHQDTGTVAVWADHQWIILGGVLGGILLVLLFILVLVLVCRLKQPINFFSATSKRLNNQGTPYASGHPSYSTSVSDRQQYLAGHHPPATEIYPTTHCSCAHIEDCYHKRHPSIEDTGINPVMMASRIQQNHHLHHNHHRTPGDCVVSQSPSSSNCIPGRTVHRCAACTGDESGGLLMLSSSPQMWRGSNVSTCDLQGGDKKCQHVAHELHGANSLHPFDSKNIERKYSDVQGRGIPTGNRNTVDSSSYKLQNSPSDLLSTSTTRPLNRVGRPLGSRGYPFSSGSLQDEQELTLASSSPSSIEKVSSVGGVGTSEASPTHIVGMQWRRNNPTNYLSPMHPPPSCSQSGTATNRRDSAIVHSDEKNGQLDPKTISTVENFRGLGFSMQPTNQRPPVISSDYASQPSSLSNQSSVSSGIGMRYPSPHEHHPMTSVPCITNTVDRPSVDGNLSFALDRVPTPEPTPRPAPLSRIAQCGEHHNLNGEMSTKVVKQMLQHMHSPTVFKKINKEVFHEYTSLTRDGISEQEGMQVYSAEDLRHEMANLEGLMKDLNRITQNQFN